MGNILICIPSEIVHRRDKNGNLELILNTVTNVIPFDNHFGLGDKYSLNKWLNKHCNNMVNFGRGYEMRIIKKVYCKVDSYKRGRK